MRYVYIVIIIFSFHVNSLFPNVLETLTDYFTLGLTVFKNWLRFCVIIFKNVKLLESNGEFKLSSAEDFCQ